MGISSKQFLKNLSRSEVLTEEELSHFRETHPELPDDGEELAKLMVREKLLTKYQAPRIYNGKVQFLNLGEYVILDTIGKGGMGQVFLAEHRRMGRKVALKTLSKLIVEDEQELKRFHQEVRATAKLSHPNIVTAFDAGEAKGIHFFVMEYVEGETLSQLIRQHGPLDVEMALQFVLQVAQGLQYAHEHGIIHRDIKASNVLMTRQGTIKILDMGLARIQTDDEKDKQEELTASGMVMGTIDYMAPEQAEDAKTADNRSDIYSLGCLLYYLLRAQPVYPEETLVKKILAHQQAPLPAIADFRSDVTGSLDALFHRMIAKKPEDRFQKMDEVIVELERLQASFRDNSALAADMSDSNMRNFLRNLGVEEMQTIVPSTEEQLNADFPPSLRTQALHQSFSTGLEKQASPKPRASQAKLIAGLVILVLIAIIAVGLGSGNSGSSVPSQATDSKSENVAVVPATEQNTESIETPQNALGDWEVARYLLLLGGTVRINDEDRDYKREKNLPKENLVLKHVDMSLCPTFKVEILFLNHTSQHQQFTGHRFRSSPITCLAGT